MMIDIVPVHNAGVVYSMLSVFEICLQILLVSSRICIYFGLRVVYVILRMLKKPWWIWKNGDWGEQVRKPLNLISFVK